MNVQEFQFTKESRFGMVALVLGGVGLAASIAGFFMDREQFFHAYLTAYCFWLAIALGGLFFTMLHHIVSADWSIVLRRITESIMIALPVMAILFIPIAVGLHDLYHWSDEAAVATDKLLQHKAGWLNPTSFFIRAAIYFSIWITLAFLLYKASMDMDGGYKDEQRARMKAISAPGIFVFALSITFASWDWIMSLDPHWYSTIFGVYFFAGSWWATLAFITQFSLYLRGQNVLDKAITVEHYHDLGKLMFGFTVFWTYIGFSQFMLIWYGNIDEETIFYKHRWENGWEYVSIFLIVGHFAIPFFSLIFRAVKRNLGALKIITLWMLFMQFVDYFWLIMPSMGSHGATDIAHAATAHAAEAAHHGIGLSWMHLSTMLGIGGIFLWTFWTRLVSKPLVPVGDPRLDISLNFHQ
jgi:hypothetical protein